MIHLFLLNNIYASWKIFIIQEKFLMYVCKFQDDFIFEGIPSFAWGKVRNKRLSAHFKFRGIPTSLSWNSSLELISESRQSIGNSTWTLYMWGTDQKYSRAFVYLFFLDFILDLKRKGKRETKTKTSLLSAMQTHIGTQCVRYTTSINHSCLFLVLPIKKRNYRC